MVNFKLKMRLLFLLCLFVIPFNSAYASWVKVVDGTGLVNNLYYDSSSSAVYAVTYTLGVLKSTNGGVTWEAKNTGIDPSFYAQLRGITGDGDGDIFLCAYGKFFRSSNGGDTWQQATATGLGTSGAPISITFDSYTNKLFLISNGDGTFWSSNLGDSWTLVNSSNINVYSIYSGKSDASGTTGMLLVGTYYSGIMKSTDGGDAWTSKGASYWLTDIISGPNDWLFAIGEYTLYRSKDYGESWTTVYSYPANTTYPNLAYDSVLGYLYASTGSNNILRSTNGGDNWDTETITLMTGSYEGSMNVQVLPNQTRLVGSQYAIYRDGPADDTTPDPFTFTAQTGVGLNATVTSNTITVSGINAPAAISITGGTYKINSGSYTSASGTVNNNDTVTVQQTSSGSYSSTTNATLTIGGVSDTFSVTTTSTPPPGAGNRPGCFIATAAFGSPLAGQVEILRQFRDRYLLTNALGQKFVSWYYRNGPVASNFIKDKPLAKAAVRLALYPLIGFSFLLISGYLPFMTVGLLISALLFLRFRQKKLGAM